MGRLISVAVLLQTFELYWIRPWKWEIIEGEIPLILKPFLKSNLILLTLRLLAAAGALIYPNPIVIAILLLTSWALAIRWRGTFNGGSDAMTFLILSAWLVAAIVPRFESVCLLYIAIQLILSYFVAGIVKIMSPQWRSGQALTYFFHQYGFQVSTMTAFILSWGVITVECLFPFAVFAPTAFVGIVIIFHLANVYIFGLNRFFFAWLAAYPALFLALAH